MKKPKQNNNYDGGFCEAVRTSPHFARYVQAGLVGGYIGSRSRTDARDKTLENALGRAGLKADGIAFWLTSTSARHLMDDVDHNTTAAEFLKKAEAAASSAFTEVTIWSHPDHGGSMLSTIELRNKIQAAFGDAKRNERIYRRLRQDEMPDEKSDTLIAEPDGAHWFRPEGGK